MIQQVIPQTDEEWAIHALNIHGTFFERSCRDVVEHAPEWKLRASNYPVEFPITIGGRRQRATPGKASNLDIWAEWIGSDGIRSIMLPIECKKRHPDFVNWVFFPASATSPSVPMVRVHQTDGKSLSSLIVPKMLRTDLIIADEARETKGDYLKVKEGDRTKTANTAITEASTQVTIATQFLLTQEKRIIDQKIRNIHNGPPPMSRQTFLPMIVTTAHLYTCNFQDADIDLETGEIPLSKASLTSCPYLLYNYPVPYALQYMPESDTRERLEQQAYMPILVVESISFPDILEKLKNFEVTGNALNLYIGAAVEP